MPRWLRQSTSVDVPIGPFVDQTDGFTAEAGLTLTQPDIRLKKNAGAWAQKAAAQTLSHEENGYYEVTLDATDTNTLGLLRLAVNETGALPVFEDFLVVPANVWDSLFGSDLLQVDATQILGDGQSATDLKDFVDAGYDPLTNKVQGVVLTDTVTNYTSNTPQTGDSFARIGATGSGLTSLASQTSINSIDDFLDTEIADIQARLPAALVSGRIKAVVEAMSAGVIDDAVVATDMDSYHARMWVIRNSTTADEYGVTFLKNGMPLESGITSPLIDYVKRLSDASILINDASLTDQGNGDYYHSEGTNKLVAGRAYMMRVTATIAGSSWVFKQQIGRDAS